MLYPRVYMPLNIGGGKSDNLHRSQHPGGFPLIHPAVLHLQETAGNSASEAWSWSQGLKRLQGCRFSGQSWGLSAVPPSAGGSCRVQGCRPARFLPSRIPEDLRLFIDSFYKCLLNPVPGD